MIDACGREITYMRMSVTELCDLRCRYCSPNGARAAHGEPMNDDEMITAVRAAASLGIRKLRITGGEPLVRPGIVELCRRVREVDGIEELCVTTNGRRLPELARGLVSAGVSRVNISIDSLIEERYAHITGGGDLSTAMRGLYAALSGGFSRIKLNSVLIGGLNDDEIPSLAELTMRYPIDVRFIELMPMHGGEFSDPASYLPGSAVESALPEAVPQSSGEGTARLWRLPGARGSVGLISPLSDRFCSRCNRIRLTADGKLKPCLHSPVEFPIRGLSFDETVEQVRRAIGAKPEQHDGLSAARRSRAGRRMNEIGG